MDFGIMPHAMGNERWGREQGLRRRHSASPRCSHLVLRGRSRDRLGGGTHALAWWWVSVLLMTAARVVDCQFVNGGEVTVDCGSCNCKGESEDGSVVVFDNPSSGNRVVSVDGDVSEIAETSCGTSAFAAGSTIYELSGVDLPSRELEVVDLSSDSCTMSSAPSSADCYSGATEKDLGDGISMTLTLCLCMFNEDSSTFYRSQVTANVLGASSVDIPNDEIEICVESGFISQLMAATVGTDTHYYNFDLVVPGEDSSSDLTVADPPGSTAQSFICGELEPTPAPITPDPPTPEPTPSPTTEPPVAPPPPPPTPSPTVRATPEPTPAPSTPIVLAEPTATPVTPDPPTPPPVAPPTPEPVQVVVTEAPVVVVPDTPQPTAAGSSSSSSSSTAAPVPLPTPVPSAIATPQPVLTTTAVPVGVPTHAPTMAANTSAPSVAPKEATSAPTGGDRSIDLEGQDCELPKEESCTTLTSVADINQGVGSFYDPSCSGISSEGDVPEGCQSNSSDSCRLCLFNTPRWKEKNPGEELPDLVDCPCCVLEVYNESTAANEEGERCEGATPAPVASTATPSTAPPMDTRLAGNLFFEDKPLRISGGGMDAGLIALGLLALLTFFPVCAK